MALKHLHDYYNKVCADYKEALQDLKDLQEECTKGLVEPERVENLRTTLNPLIQNYEQISYLIYLLNMPKKKNSNKVYVKAHKKELDKISASNRTDALLQVNKEVLNKLKEFKGYVN